MSERSISAGPNDRNAWNTSGMSTVRASIVGQPVVAGGGEDAVVEAPVGLVQPAHAVERRDVDLAAHGAELVGGVDERAELLSR